MKRFYAPYTEWEDFKNGMYEVPPKEGFSDYVQKGVYLLSDKAKFLEASKRVIMEWPIASRVNLTNPSCNRRAWIGQAACSIDHKSTETHVRKSWSLLTQRQQAEANEIADIVINSFLINHERQDKEIRF